MLAATLLLLGWASVKLIVEEFSDGNNRELVERDSVDNGSAVGATRLDSGGGELDARSDIDRGFDLMLFASVQAVAGEGLEVVADEARGLRAYGLPPTLASEPELLSQRRFDVRVASQDWTALVCAPGRPWDCDWALSVIACESGGNPAALGMERYEGQLWYFHGLWQIASLSPDPRLLADPVYNTDRAEEKYRSGGAAHWPLCGMAR